MRHDIGKTFVFIQSCLKSLKPPKTLTVSKWAEENRMLTLETGATPGMWRTEKTPYLREPMDAFTDPQIKRITLVASAQVGKTEMMLNMIGYAIDIDPGPIIICFPTDTTAEDFSKRRFSVMVRNCKPLKRKIAANKGRDSNNTTTKKAFPGGMLSIVNSHSPASLASTPTRYVFGDERDRWADSAGNEGDPWKLLEARTRTFYNSKMVEVSTPTVKDVSAIEKAYNEGTMERWCLECPSCNEYNSIYFKDIIFDTEQYTADGKTFKKPKNVYWQCPECGVLATELEMRRQESRWIAGNPKALEKGHRSFWVTAFSSASISWTEIVQKRIDAADDPQQLKTVYNTILGELWEDRNDGVDENDVMERLEDYPNDADLPDGVLALTCGVDTQDDRLEYEIVGFGRGRQSWGIKYGVILGNPLDGHVWEELDKITEKRYIYESGKSIKISATFIDSGGSFTQEVYERCRIRQNRNVFAVKGRGGENVEFVSRPKKHELKPRRGENKKRFCWLYSLGVDSGKTEIMSSLAVQSPDKLGYCHFPKNEERGYNDNYFRMLFSERLVYKNKRRVWEKVKGQKRNEALDCRNYALAAFKTLTVDFDKLEQQLADDKPEMKRPPQTAGTIQPKRLRKNSREEYSEW